MVIPLVASKHVFYCVCLECIYIGLFVYKHSFIYNYYMYIWHSGTQVPMFTVECYVCDMSLPGFAFIVVYGHMDIAK